MSIYLFRLSRQTYTAGARVMHVRKACNDRGIKCEAGLVLASRVGDGFCHTCDWSTVDQL